MKRTLLVALVLLAIGATPRADRSDDLRARAIRLHRSAIVIDTHEDVPYWLEEKGWADIGQRLTTGHVDIPRLKEGGVTGPFFAAYVPAAFADAGGSAKKALEEIALVHQLVADHPADLVFADSPAGVRDAKRKGKIGVLIGIEGGHAIEDSLGALAAFHRLGVRYMTLTHTNTNHWADSSGSFWSPDFDPKKYAVHGGLTDFGREVVLEMNRLGMLVDVSHVSDETIADVLETSRAPVFASHSSCRALSNIPRNLTDDQIRSIAATGGVVMVNIGSIFLDQKVVDDFLAKRAALAPTFAEIAEKYKDDPKKRAGEISKVMDGIRTSRASWRAVVDHIERILKIGGTHAAGLGTDFDGIEDPPEGLEDVSKLPVLTEELLRRGHSEEEVRGVLGENFLRFWGRANAARENVPPRKEPMPFSKP
ncbi:MAG TPA: dipeptidase [Thermoanaerobaculia bacterium]|jgi:membrane dipeptidase|nr:dipeptidase [Thermoanaerobaculia bacterium]